MSDFVFYAVLGPPAFAILWYIIFRMWKGSMDPGRAVPWVNSDGESGYNATLTPLAAGLTLFFAGAGVHQLAPPD